MNRELICYQSMPVWTADTLPEAVLSKHNTKAGTWGKLRILQGSLKFYELDEQGAVKADHILTPESGVWTIEPQAWHKVAPLGDDLQMQLEFYCDKADFFHKKYGMTATHSAVKAAVKTVRPCKAIDLGCGQGRNALYLSLLGFDVTAVDYHPGGAQALADMAAQEGLDLKAGVYDMNTAALPENYDFMVATVVFMFLQAERVPAIIADMQVHTRPGGYNLIVSAMDTADYPCRMPFSFTFKEDELRHYYADWALLEYREEIGSMHATDEYGNPIQLKFVTMLARKPE